ncbi:MAG: ferrous iron transport protein A [bacterium]|nr:ferrous iron transport protein A [bacterium]
MNLTALHSGESAIIEEVEAGRSLRSRLMALGMLPGTPIEVIKLDRSGPVVLEVHDSRVVIGRGIARKIEVKAIEKTKEPKTREQIKETCKE